jgi:hypothetical protein
LPGLPSQAISREITPMTSLSKGNSFSALGECPVSTGGDGLGCERRPPFLRLFEVNPFRQLGCTL